MSFFNTTQPTTLSVQGMTAGGRDDGEAAELGGAGLLLRPGEDSRLCPGKQASDLDSMLREIETQKKTACPEWD